MSNSMKTTIEIHNQYLIISRPTEITGIYTIRNSNITFTHEGKFVLLENSTLIIEDSILQNVEIIATSAKEITINSSTLTGMPEKQGLTINTCRKVSITDCYFKDFNVDIAGSAIRIINSGVAIENSTFENCGQQGAIYLKSLREDTAWRNNQFINCQNDQDVIGVRMTVAIQRWFFPFAIPKSVTEVTPVKGAVVYDAPIRHSSFKIEQYKHKTLTLENCSAKDCELFDVRNRHVFQK